MSAQDGPPAEPEPLLYCFADALANVGPSNLRQ